MELNTSTTSSQFLKRSRIPRPPKPDKNAQIISVLKTLGIVQAHFQDLEPHQESSFSSVQTQDLLVKTGTGFLIGPNKVITAAENLVDLDSEKTLSKIIFYPSLNSQEVIYEDELVEFEVKSWKVNEFFQFSSEQDKYRDNFALLILKQRVNIEGEYIQMHNEIHDYEKPTEGPTFKAGFKYDFDRKAFIKTFEEVKLKERFEGLLSLENESGPQQCGSPLIVPVVKNGSLTYQLQGLVVGPQAYDGISFNHLLRSGQINSDSLELLGTEALLKGFLINQQNSKNEAVESFINYQQQIMSTILKINEKYEIHTKLKGGNHKRKNAISIQRSVLPQQNHSIVENDSPIFKKENMSEAKQENSQNVSGLFKYMQSNMVEKIMKHLQSDELTISEKLRLFNELQRIQDPQMIEKILDGQNLFVVESQNSKIKNPLSESEKCYTKCISALKQYQQTYTKEQLRCQQLLKLLNYIEQLQKEQKQIDENLESNQSKEPKNQVKSESKTTTVKTGAQSSGFVFPQIKASDLFFKEAQKQPELHKKDQPEYERMGMRGSSVSDQQTSFSLNESVIEQKDPTEKKTESFENQTMKKNKKKKKL